MSNFAKIENGVVTQVIVIADENDSIAEEYLHGLGLKGKWVAAFGKKDASVGDTYVESTGNFKPAQPFASWKWNATDWAWIAPKPYPTDGAACVWDETVTDWVAI